MTPVHKTEGDKVGLRLALRDWIYIVTLLAGMIGYFVRIEVKTSEIPELKADVKELKEYMAESKARHALRAAGPSRGDRDR